MKNRIKLKILCFKINFTARVCNIARNINEKMFKSTVLSTGRLTSLTGSIVGESLKSIHKRIEANK
ncbi:hypothetical protein ACI2JA_03295 [Alkalihalobacillus sp. NPDC078783]